MYWLQSPQLQRMRPTKKNECKCWINSFLTVPKKLHMIFKPHRNSPKIVLNDTLKNWLFPSKRNLHFSDLLVEIVTWIKIPINKKLKISRQKLCTHILLWYFEIALMLQWNKCWQWTCVNGALLCLTSKQTMPSRTMSSIVWSDELMCVYVLFGRQPNLSRLTWTHWLEHSNIPVTNDSKHLCIDFGFDSNTEQSSKEQFKRTFDKRRNFWKVASNQQMN